MKSALALLAAALAAGPVLATECPPGEVTPAAQVEADWARLDAEVEGMTFVAPLPFEVAGRPVFRARTGADALGGVPDRVRARLGAIAPRLETVLAELGATRGRPVLLIESRSSTFGDALAFTVCAEAEERLGLAEATGAGNRIPPGACAIVVYPDRIASDADLDFVLAHEWMHTFQVETYGPAFDGGGWWREGSAEWFAHRVVPGYEGRDPLFQQFFEEQAACPLTRSDYPAQVFFLWADAAIYARWGFELGIGGRDYLRTPGRAAQVLPPDRWLDFARAQIDGTIRLPDGRALTARPEAPPLDLQTCARRVEGPPLSAQFRTVTIPEGRPLGVDPGGAQIALRHADGTWTDLSGGGRFDLPPGEATLAAILPGGRPLSARVWTGEGEGETCACLIGSWMEEPLDDGFRFRSGAPEAVAGVPLEGGAVLETAFVHPGPILTLSGDGTFAIDDPAVQTASAGGEPFWSVRQSVHQRYGTWEESGERLRLRTEGTRQRATLVAAGVSHAIDEDRRRRDRGGAAWTAACEGDVLTFRGPMAPEMRATGQPAGVVATFRRVPPP